MTKTNCRNVRREIEETALGDLLSSLAYNHLKDCSECEKFCDERTKLREMVFSLGTVEAPGDFEFRLSARLAAEKPGVAKRFDIRNLSLGFRAATFALVLFAIGSAIVFVRFQSPATSKIAVSNSNTIEKPGQPAAKAENSSEAVSPAANLAVSAPETVSPNAQPDRKPRRTSQTMQVAKARDRRLGTRDFGSAQALVSRSGSSDESDVFPIAAANQSLRLSVDNGRGSSRTISFPTVSFGSQRAVSRNTSGLMASARGAW